MGLEGEDALLPVADGEVGIRHHGEIGHRLLLHELINVLHPGLFAAAEIEGDLALQGNPQLPQALHHVHTDHGGVFVVGAAPADEKPVLLQGLVGGVDPVVSLRHHVQVGEEADGGVPLPVLGQTVPVAAVLGGKAVALRQLQSLVQGVCHPLAKGQSVGPVVADAGDPHQGGKIPHQSLPAAYGVLLDALLQFFRNHFAVAPSR